jgi:hypothetical protein
VLAEAGQTKLQVCPVCWHTGFLQLRAFVPQAPGAEQFADTLLEIGRDTHREVIHLQLKPSSPQKALEQGACELAQAPIHDKMLEAGAFVDGAGTLGFGAGEGLIGGLCGAGGGLLSLEDCGAGEGLIGGICGAEEGLIGGICGAGGGLLSLEECGAGGGDCGARGGLIAGSCEGDGPKDCGAGGLIPEDCGVGGLPPEDCGAGGLPPEDCGAGG